MAVGVNIAATLLRKVQPGGIRKIAEFANWEDGQPVAPVPNAR